MLGRILYKFCVNKNSFVTQTILLGVAFILKIIPNRVSAYYLLVLLVALCESKNILFVLHSNLWVFTKPCTKNNQVL